MKSNFRGAHGLTFMGITPGVSFEQFGLSMERHILIGFTPVLHGREMAAQGINVDFSGLLAVTHL